MIERASTWVVGTVVVVLVCAFGLNAAGYFTPADQAPGPKAKVRTRAAAEASLRAEVDTLAGLAGTPVTDWTARTVVCDTAQPGGLWVMLGSARLPVPAARQPAVLTAFVAHWRPPAWKVYDQPDGPHPGDGRWLSAWAEEAGDLTFDLHTRTTGDYLTVKFATPCYQPAEGENPAAG